MSRAAQTSPGHPQLILSNLILAQNKKTLKSIRQLIQRHKETPSPTELMRIERNTEELLLEIQLFIETQISCHEESQKLNLHQRLDLDQNEDLRNRNRNFEIAMSKIDQHLQIPDSALSCSSSPKANVTLLAHLLAIWETIRDTKTSVQRDHHLQHRLIEKQQEVIYNILSHISDLISADKIRP